jgi:CarD family transcriptional regulator
MHFSVGDTVVHPMHGAGRIAEIQHKELVEGFEHYYVVEISGQVLTVFVPVRKADELGIRPAMSGSELALTLDTLGDSPQRLPEEHQDRQDRILEKLKTGDPIQIAETVRDLTQRRQMDHLTQADSRLLDRGRRLLAAEMALVSGTTVTDAGGAIDAALTGSVRREAGQERPGRIDEVTVQSLGVRTKGPSPLS